MQDNAQNNWKQRLEAADNFTGEILQDKNEAWEKLYARLHKKPARKYLNRYWAAAACLVVITLTAIFFLGKGKHQRSDIVSSPVKKHKAATINNSLVKEQKDKNNASFQSQQKASISISSGQKNISLKKIDPLKTNDLVVDANKEVITETATQPVLQSDSLKKIANSAPVKKKLRVVHINDIGQPMEESTADNPFVERHRFQLRIINNENYNPASESPANNGLILFKSKNASN